MDKMRQIEWKAETRRGPRGAVRTADVAEACDSLGVWVRMLDGRGRSLGWWPLDRWRLWGRPVSDGVA